MALLQNEENMKTNNPTAFALLKDGKKIAFYDFYSGEKLDDKFEGTVRVYMGGVVNALMATTLDHRTGVRSWFKCR